MSKPIDDEWWTTEMVCAHLKLSKRALWDIRNAPNKGFPLAIKPGGKVNLFRAADVRAWMAARAQVGVRTSKAPAVVLTVMHTAPAPTSIPAKDVVAIVPSTAEPQQSPVTEKAPARKNATKRKAADLDQLSLF